MEIKKQYKTPNRLTEMMLNIKEIDDAVSRGEKEIVLPKIGWVYPLSLLPIVVHANDLGIGLKYTGSNVDVYDYLERVCFPQGITTLSSIENDFLPITKLFCGEGNPILSEYEERILKNVSEECRDSFISGLKILTSELQSNVEEHAKVGFYWIFAQYWEKTKTCEICIIDRGIGYRESYRGTKHEVNTHKESILNAVKGISSKLPDERGAGLQGIRNMFIKGYKGEMIIMSGNSLLYEYQKKSVMYKCPTSWPGALVGLKFRLKEIDVSQYYG